MKIKLLMGFNTTRADGTPWPPVGSVIDLPDTQARGLIANGHAIAVDTTPLVERATIEAPAERATITAKVRGKGVKRNGS